LAGRFAKILQFAMTIFACAPDPAQETPKPEGQENGVGVGVATMKSTVRPPVYQEVSVQT